MKKKKACSKDFVNSRPQQGVNEVLKADKILHINSTYSTLLLALTSVRFTQSGAACSVLQYIDSADLEPVTLQEEPVKYHEAWHKLCSSQ